MKYDKLGPISRSDAQRELGTALPEEAATILIRLALHDPDSVWLLQTIVPYLDHHHAWVRGSAATSIGHIARIHEGVDIGRVVPLLRKLRNDPEIGGKAQDALDDIEVFQRDRP